VLLEENKMQKIKYSKFIYGCGAGINKVNFNNNYPEHIGLMDGLDTKEDFENVYGVFCDDKELINVNTLLELTTQPSRWFYDSVERSLFITTNNFDDAMLHNIELLVD
jgi:hypothetical protein